MTKNKKDGFLNGVLLVWFIGALLILIALLIQPAKSHANEQKLYPKWMYAPQPIMDKETGAVCYVKNNEWVCKAGRGKTSINQTNSNSGGGGGIPFNPYFFKGMKNRKPFGKLPPRGIKKR